MSSKFGTGKASPRPPKVCKPSPQRIDEQTLPAQQMQYIAYARCRILYLHPPEDVHQLLTLNYTPPGPWWDSRWLPGPWELRAQLLRPAPAGIGEAWIWLYHFGVPTHLYRWHEIVITDATRIDTGLLQAQDRGAFPRDWELEILT